MFSQRVGSYSILLLYHLVDDILVIEEFTGAMTSIFVPNVVFISGPV